MSSRAPAGLSEVRGETDQPLEDLTVDRVLRRTVESRGDQEAFVFGEQQVRWTWAAFAEQVDQMASALVDLGLRLGDRIGIWSPNRPEWVLTQFASARIGLVLVTINPAYRENEAAHALRTSQCAALVTATSHKSSEYIAMLQSLAPELASCEPGDLSAERLPDLRVVIEMADQPTPGCLTFDSLLRELSPEAIAELDRIEASLQPDDPINIQFTSGTTGAPKGATLSHRNIVNNSRFIVSGQRLTSEDVLCVPVPLYHCFGMVAGTLGCAGVGTKIVFPGAAFDPDQVVAALEQECCTAVYGVPTMFLAMLASQQRQQRDLSRMRTGVMAGAPCPAELLGRSAAELNLAEITICYGMTETSPISFQTSIDDPIDKRYETVGRVHPHVEVKIIDAHGQTVSLGQSGELCVRGYSVMLGYWNDEQRTREAVDADGWMHTGDLASLDADGYGRIIGRVKDMIIRGGENIYPREVENALLEHPDVVDAQVFGIHDDTFGEQVCAWVRTEPGSEIGEDALRDFCRERMAHFKVPKLLRIVEAFPMTVTGKAQKFRMRELMEVELGVTR
ncbi:AMP-binding protein [Nocardia sp. NPDC049707]|uniref:AMP-binding protein n=1 Tax=Nocardia sp. NPDC049707 TaxID=3154735 RepID=UPI00343B72C7